MQDMNAKNPPAAARVGDWLETRGIHGEPGRRGRMPLGIGERHRDRRRQIIGRGLLVEVLLRDRRDHRCVVGAGDGDLDGAITGLEDGLSSSAKSANSSSLEMRSSRSRT